MAAANLPTYKWWETDDKTKRLYTELLAEKLSSPRKTSDSSLSRKPSNGKDIGARLTSSPKRNPAPSDATNSTARDVPAVKKKEEKGGKDNKLGKYTFETITIDTLAKYDYIKSPQKRAAPTVPISFFEQTSKAANQTLRTQDNKENAEKELAKTSNVPFLMSQKLSTVQKELQEPKTAEENQASVMKRDGTKKDKASRAMKLEEIPEYTSSESNESSADETVVIGKTATKEENKAQMPVTDSKQIRKNKESGQTHQPLKIGELSTKFQLLSEEVAQLEFKMFEFSDDIQKLKKNMGFKSANTEEKKEDRSSSVEKKNEYRLTRQKSFTFADKFNNKAVLMKQQASPSKMLAAKPGKFFPGNLALESSNKEDAMADLKKNEALNEIVSKIKEQELSDDDIQEILRCAKDKYIDRPNYLEEIGYGQNNE